MSSLISPPADSPRRPGTRVPSKPTSLPASADLQKAEQRAPQQQRSRAAHWFLPSSRPAVDEAVLKAAGCFDLASVNEWLTVAPLHRLNTSSPFPQGRWRWRGERRGPVSLLAGGVLTGRRPPDHPGVTDGRHREAEAAERCSTA